MTKPYEEQISALSDGELPDAEMQLLLRVAERSEDVAARMGRYAVIREALHRNLPDHVDTSLAARVSAAVEDEPVHTAGPGYGASGHRWWLRPVGGAAIAASVALMAIAIWPQQSSTPDGDVIETASAPSAAQQTSAGQPVSAESIQWDRLDSDIQTRLDEYAVIRERTEPQLDFLSRPVGVSDRRGEN
ncbi:sigma-E factor negative regulatory protein [Aquisalimonas asiatica]|uniref:Anti sigma-E protein, RseA n=1 Tax=Aquisalimonas asiatica TaxID=406100 RepID=A0A1H8QC44_9GAMM|nr:sigma-E factor negative regulatory protein [Aquisalimonas asiatica]SEO51782.1 anti sigma-E protein, RseA [Aquisalimonas asiatica]